MSAPGGIPFGHFTLGKRLARGGMAEVFLARQRGPEGFDRRVAVKRILPHLADSTDFVGMFLDEARLAARLTHPNIVHIYELGSVDGSFFIAMEYVDGVTAAQLIKHAEREQLPPVLVARIGADAAGALAYAHRLQDGEGQPLHLVHRDVSPANVMVSFDGIVKLVDFGIAKAANKAEETRPGIVKGKYAYMSPEQTTGKPLDGRSDVFSLGVVMWELLSGRAIVERGDVVEAMKVIRDGRFPPVEEVAPHVPPPLAAAVGWALENRRDDRATAAQLQVALEEFIKSSPQLATPVQLADWVQSRFPRASTRELPPFEPRAARPVRRTEPPPAPVPAPLGTQVVAITGESPEVTPPPGPPPRPPGLPPPLPRGLTPAEDYPTIDESTEGGTTRIHEPRVMRAQARARTWRRLAAGGAALVVAAIVVAVIVSAGGEADLRAAAPPEDASRAIVVAPVDAPTPVRDPVIDPPAIDAGPPPVEAPAAATVEIVTRPGKATVRLGDDRTGTSPVGFAGVEPGRYTVVVEKDGYAPLTRTLDLASGERRTLELTLEKEKASRPAAVRTGYLTARTEPYSVVYLGTRRLGETPFAEVALPAGTHTLQFRHPGRPPVSRTVTVRPGRTVKLNFKL